MARKQADYLKELLADTAVDPNPTPPVMQQVTPPAPNVKSGMTLLARESALARVATGEVKQVTQLQLDPARIRIWKGNPRHQASLTEESCRDLIDTIIAEGGQKVAAIVRRVADDPAFDYEVIAGSRRHWAISWLRANNYPEMLFLVQVHNLDDEAAFRIADIENRARKDISDFERARTYLAALDRHYGGKQVRMAERLRLSKGWLSKMITVASLPDWIVDAFASPTDIQLKTCYPMAQKVLGLMEVPGDRVLTKIEATALALANEQSTLQQEGRPPIPAVDVIKRLLSSESSDEAETDIVKFDMPTGRTALSVLSSNRNGVSIRLHAGSGASEAELARMFRAALAELDRQGRGLRY